MRINPVYKRETMISARSFRLTLVLIVFNGILALVALLNMYSALAQVRTNAMIQYSTFLDLYAFVATIEFILLMFIMPAITAGSISGERERQTLDLMLTTQMTPAEIVFGKLAAALSTVLLLVLSSFPVLALVFVYGGVTVPDLVTLLGCFIVVALLTGSLGICVSALLKKSTMATVTAYGAMLFMVAGTYAINYLIYSMSQMSQNHYTAAIHSSMGQASSGSVFYLLLINPAVTFLSILNSQAGDGQVGSSIASWFGIHDIDFLFQHWAVLSMLLQLALAGLLLWVAVRALEKKR